MTATEIAGTPITTYPRQLSVMQRFKKTLQANLMWYLFVAPAVILILVFMVVPIFEALSLAMYRWNGVRPREFVGFENFIDLFDDRFFMGALQHTVLFSITATLGTVGLGLLLAVAISRNVPGAALYRILFYLPVMVPITVVGALWVRILEPNFGLLNTFLRGVGLDGLARAWLGDISIALIVLMAVTIWQYSGFPMIVLLAAIENISEEIHDAASLDGVSEWQRLAYITLPLIRPVLISISVLQIIFSLKVFDLVWVMTRGGPGQSTDVLGTFLFDEAFFKRQYGYASAVAVAMFIIIFTITYIYQRVVRVENAKL
ncbi:MAG: sugar ABC transporter permease [Burkholderiales bacterium]|nr:sugar ABC transporter permease [Anaerolineae bacterium]